jgi:uncharacterized Tic20 family protein
VLPIEPHAKASAPPPYVRLDERRNAALVHVGGFFTSISLPLILWLIQDDRWSFSARHIREALNYQINFLIAVWSMFVPASIVFFACKTGEDPADALVAGVYTLLGLTALLYIVNVTLVARATQNARLGYMCKYPCFYRFV